MGILMFDSIGYIGISVAFMLLAAIVLIKAIWKTSHILKSILIAGVLWFGVVLYYSTLSFTGWPSPQAIPKNSRMISFRIEEPSIKKNSPGGIFFWLDISSENEKAVILELLNPTKMLAYYSDVEPRAYKIPYSKDMHKRLLEIMKKRKEGYQVFVKGKKGKKTNKKDKRKSNNNEDKIELRIVNPVDLLPKQ